jgi:serine/threonine protein kinase
VHRDVKPFSILIDTVGRLRLSGFSIATKVGRPIEREGYVVGTPSYMSPEQILNQPVGPHTDVWGLGATLYETLCLHRPFDVEGERDIAASAFKALLNLEPRDPRHFDSTIPPELARICLKCLSKDLNIRYRDCQTVADDLEAWKQHLPKMQSGQIWSCFHKSFKCRSRVRRE